MKVLPHSTGCGPCRGFTPKLADAYKAFAAEKDFEIVFISSDRDQASFESYYGEMPWLSLPFGERDLKNKLSKKFKVQGIPSFVILDGATGEIITKDGAISPPARLLTSRPGVGESGEGCGPSDD